MKHFTLLVIANQSPFALAYRQSQQDNILFCDIAKLELHRLYGQLAFTSEV